MEFFVILEGYDKGFYGNNIRLYDFDYNICNVLKLSLFNWIQELQKKCLWYEVT